MAFWNTNLPAALIIMESIAAQTLKRLDTFFGALRTVRHRALMLDYDGTLAPFVERRDEAWPYAGVRTRLTELMTLRRTRVVIVSGRPCNDVIPLLGIEPVPELWGSHGWEHRPEGQNVELNPLTAIEALALAEAGKAAREAGLGSAIELKPASLALHWRGAPEREAEIRDHIAHNWRRWVREAGLVIHAFDGGRELQVPGRDKGHAVRAVIDSLPRGAMHAFLGDDFTDENAFRALNESIGSAYRLSVLIRETERVSAADIWLTPPEGTLDFLDRWLEVDRASA